MADAAKNTTRRKAGSKAAAAAAAKAAVPQGIPPQKTSAVDPPKAQGIPPQKTSAVDPPEQIDTSLLKIKTPPESPKEDSKSLTVADTSSIFTLPLDNTERYMEVWNMCSQLFESFKGPAKDHTGTSLKVEAIGNNVKIMSLDKREVFDEKVTVEAAGLMILFRYRDLVEQTSKKKFSTPAEFFNELEANREYHARAIIILASTDNNTISQDLAVALKVSDMDTLDQILFEENNKGVPFAPYEKAFLVTHMMIKMAEWEKMWLGSNLFKDEYMVAIVTPDQNKDLPSHLRLLANGVNNVKEQAMNVYPQSCMMNYSMFYPFILYPTGVPPNGATVKPVTAHSSSSITDDRKPIGTRKYTNGREVSYYDTNNTKRQLSNGWFSSRSEKIEPGKEFFFKQTGEATWENPIDNPKPTLVKKASSDPPSTPPSTEAEEQLPTGWQRVKSKTTGKYYYVGPNGEKQWETPKNP